MKKSLLILVVLMLLIIPLYSDELELNTTFAGVTGYIGLPSAHVTSSFDNPTITTGYTGIYDFQKGFSHIPFIEVGFLKNFEGGAAVDITNEELDLLINAKWRFIDKDSVAFAFGMVGELLTMREELSFGGKAYFASTFNSSFVGLPSKTSILLGYSIDKNSIDSNIDFGMAFQSPLFPKFFKEKVDFIIDFGNVAYSNNPSGGNANNRGMLNVGLRVLPLKLMKGTYLTIDLSFIDLFDHIGRGVSLGASISFMP